MGEQTLAQRIKAKFPGEYDDIPDYELEEKVLAKYPGEYDDLPRSSQPMGDLTRDIGGGMVKGLAQTAVDVAGIAPRLYGAPDPRAEGGAFHELSEFAKTKTQGENVGKLIEQAGEFVIPGMAGERLAAGMATKLPKLARVPVRMGVNAATSGAHASLHEDDPIVAAAAAAGGTLLGEGGAAVGRWIGRKAKPLIKSGLKLTDTELAQQSTAKVKGLAGEQDEITDFLLEKRWLDPAQAEANLQKVGAERSAAYAASPARFNPGQTSMQALDDLAARARQETDGGVDTLRAIEKERRRMMTGPLSRPGSAPAPTAVAPQAMGTGTATPGPVMLTPGALQPVRITASPRSSSTGTAFSAGPPTLRAKTPSTQPVTMPTLAGPVDVSSVPPRTTTAFRTTTSMSPGAVQPMSAASVPVSAPQSTTALSPAAQPPTATGRSVPAPNPGRRVAPKREFRDDVTAEEMQTFIEADGKKLRGQWGKPSHPVTKAKNSAMRKDLKTGVDTAIPKGQRTTADMLAEEGLSKRSKTALDRMQKRQNNLGPFSAPLLIGTSSAVTSGALGNMEGALAAQILAVGGHLIRNNPVKAGYLAKDLSDAVASKNVERTAQILQKLGIGVASQIKGPESQ